MHARKTQKYTQDLVHSILLSKLAAIKKDYNDAKFQKRVPSKNRVLKLKIKKPRLFAFSKG